MSLENVDLPVGPPLPPLYSVIGEQMNVELDTADDLIDIQLPPQFASLAGTDHLKAADFFNFIILLRDPSALSGAAGGAGFDTSALDVQALLPALQECRISPLTLLSNPGTLFEGMIRCVTPEDITYLANHDPSFLSGLQPEVYDYFSDDVLRLPQIAPPLPDTWDMLAGQAPFSDKPLRSAADLIALGQGSAAGVLNAIDAATPEQFAGYEVRLFSSLSPTIMRYLALQEGDFYGHLDADVLRKLAPETLAALPAATLNGLDARVWLAICRH